ncbi:MAG: PEGA domain-containing protein [Firmicutes bacterium]|nr:PEGA domain-containing protein [Bacillota bacterium]
MNNRFYLKASMVLIISLLSVFSCFGSAFADDRRAILVVGDKSDKSMTQKEENLKKFLLQYRKQSGNDSSTLPIFIYDFSVPEVKNYCEKKLGIHQSDILFLGIVQAQGKLPEKVIFKVTNPKDLEDNARLMVEKFSSGAAGGSLVVNSVPAGAKVWIEKTYKGRTPITIKGLAEGDYTLTLVKSGYALTKKTVFIGENKSSTVKVAMPSTAGALVVKSTPPGAEVYVDDAFYGKTPLNIPKVEPGTRKVVLKNGSQSWTGTVKISIGKTVTLSPALPGEKVAMAKKPEINAKKPAPPVKKPVTDKNPKPVKTPTKAPAKGSDEDYSPPVSGGDPGSEINEAFIPKSETNSVFQITVTNIEEVASIKDYYKPKPGYKFAIVYLQQQNVSNEVQIYTGKFSLVDQKNSSFEALDKLSNFWLVVLRPGGVNMGYLVFEIPEDSKSMALVLHGLNMSPLSVSFNK